MINKQMARQYLSVILGKAVKKVASLRGGGSALPGLVIEKIDPQFLVRSLKQLPLGVVVISGTNGKTTTTKIVVELLESAGLKVFTNKTGSNFSRGVAAALLGEMDINGKISADIAVLELDEAWAAKFVQKVKPRYSLLLNVLRDQLDRFGEIDKTASLLEKIALATTETVVLNRDDKRILKIADKVSCQVKFFGTTTELLKLMPSDEGLKYAKDLASESVEADVKLTSVDGQKAEFLIDDQTYQAKLNLSGIYNLLNAAAALSLTRTILIDAKKSKSNDELVSALSKVKPAFGRGEIIELNSQPIELILVKNPSGFRLALLSFADIQPTMIAINDNYADGRDMSWLWDVDFSSLPKVQSISGIRAYDMALRLMYDDVKIGDIETDIALATDKFLSENSGQPIRIFASYTAMLQIRKILSKLTDVEAVS